MQSTSISAWQAAKGGYALFFRNLPQLGLALLKMLAVFILANGLVLTFFYEPPAPGTATGAHFDPGANLDLLAFLFMSPFLVTCGRLALTGAPADGAYFSNIFRKREARFLFAMLGASIAGLLPIGLTAVATVMLLGPGASPSGAVIAVIAVVALLALVLSSIIFFRALIWPLAAAVDKSPPFKTAFSLGGRTVWKAFAATALASGPFLVINILLGLAAYAWIGGDPAAVYDKRFLLSMDVSTGMVQALHMGLMIMACAMIAKKSIPELFDGAVDATPQSTQTAPGETP